MADSKKVAISLPAKLLRKVESKRHQTGETRSAFIKRTIESLFKEEEKKKLIAQYIEGYQKYPESRDEADALTDLADEVLAEEPWE